MLWQYKYINTYLLGNLKVFTPCSFSRVPVGAQYFPDFLYYQSVNSDGGLESKMMSQNIKIKAHGMKISLLQV